MVEPAIAVAKTMYVNVMDVQAEAMASTMKLPNKVHTLHHNLCAGVDENEIRPEADKLVKAFCSPDAKVAANYATFLATIPAWGAELEFRDRLTIVGIDQDEITERVNKHINKINSFKMPTPKIVRKFLDQINK